MSKKHHTITLCLTFIISTLFWSCKTSDLVPSNPVTFLPITVDGDTVKTTYLPDFALEKVLKNNQNYSIVVESTTIGGRNIVLPALNGNAPDLSNIKNVNNPNLKGKPIRYVAIGSSLTAGVRDGGYFNEGIQTSFPALIAHQMRLEKFEQPLFAPQDYNGFGRNIKTDFNPTGGPVQKFARSNNNLGIENDGAEVKAKSLQRKFESFDNLGIPNISDGSILMPFEGSLFQINRFPNWVNVSNYSVGAATLSGKSPMIEQYRKLDADFFTIEFSSSYLTAIITGKGPLSYNGGPSLSEPPILTVLKEFKKKGMKGVFANVPNPYYFPVMEVIDVEKYYETLLGTYDFYKSKEEFINTYKVKPTSVGDSLASDKVNIALKKRNDPNLLDQFYTTQLIELTNKEIENISKESGFPIVDLRSLYERIIEGTYVTNDGILVDPSLENGNFFSNDGIFPTAFGNAIIANEFIRTINSHYKLKIPLIATAPFLSIK